MESRQDGGLHEAPKEAPRVHAVGAGVPSFVHGQAPRLGRRDLPCGWWSGNPHGGGGYRRVARRTTHAVPTLAHPRLSDIDGFRVRRTPRDQRTRESRIRAARTRPPPLGVAPLVPCRVTFSLREGC